MKGGLLFDISGLLYINVFYMLLCLLPLKFKFNKWYQAFLKGLFIITNAAGLFANVADIIYYRVTLKRTTFSVFDQFKNEDNMLQLWMQFVIDFWYALLFLIVLVFLLVYLYGRVKPKPFLFKSNLIYGISGTLILVFFVGLSVMGIRGGWRHSTRPINMSNAGKYAESPEQMAIVLNTPFCVLRTIGKETFKPLHYFPDDRKLMELFTPEIHPRDSGEMKKLNIVVIILESFSRESVGSLNRHIDNGNYKGYTPFLDSLISVSYTFSNAYANGRKSIDAMPSVLASLPALVQPYVVSEYSSNRVNGFGNLLKPYGYHTSFFHGAPNGSMGFQAFSRMIGIEHYFGKNEYANDADFDGIWGIWDEPFQRYFAHTLEEFPQPFFSSVFTISSHHPFKVPKEYEDVFPKGTLPVHRGIGYTDMGLRSFFEIAKESGWYQNTLFVITADHSVTPHYAEYKTNVNAFAIPIIFYSPALNLKGMDNRLAQQTDILPTVLNLINYPDGYIAFGNDLFGKEKKSFVLNYISESFQFMQNDKVLYFDGKKVISFYDYVTDPFLKNNLKERESVPVAESELMKAVIQQYNNRMIENNLLYKNKAGQ
jgi:phosphoglycerol transferase MdoB-like AlkP superfamily enzyme